MGTNNYAGALRRQKRKVKRPLFRRIFYIRKLWKRPIMIALILAGCSKDPSALPTRCEAATFYVDTYRDTTWSQLIKTEATHFCRVCDELLSSYKKLNPDMQICPGEPKRQRIVIGVDTCKTSTK